MAESPKATSPLGRDEFYVGYLPVPTRLRRFLWRITPTLLVLLAGIAWILASAQRDPGAGIWNDAEAKTFVGVIDASPYPLIRVTDEAGEAVTYLLVEVGKFGGGQRAAPFAGKAVRLSGWVLERDGRRMIELEPGDTIHAAEDVRDAERFAPPRRETLGERTLRGEIVDSKCYLGAMKPGDGKTHKQCATLCIAGGIPPTFVTRDEAGRRAYYLMTNRDGGPFDERILPLVADQVEMRGSVERRGDLLIIRTDADTIRRY
ncbi:MAG: hypothetical protein KDA32_06600 [Phycisphaerales bacterium]|nr:hypothetical protein [Phycisphaerales bacterium]